MPFPLLDGVLILILERSTGLEGTPGELLG